MKKVLALLLTLVLLMTAASAARISVPRSASQLPSLPSAPAAPGIVRMQRAGDALTVTFDQPLAADALVIFRAVDADLHTLRVTAEPAEQDRAYAASGLPDGGEWTGCEVSWTEAGSPFLARYNAAGGLTTSSAFDRSGNEYRFDADGRFCAYASASSTLQARFNTRGVMTIYGYEAFEDTTVWFSREGTVMFAEYDDGTTAAQWEPGKGWFVNTSAGRTYIQLDVRSPWNAKCLFKEEKDDTDDDADDTAETIWYPNNTVMLCGLTLQEADPSLPEKWYNVIPVDLRQEGRQTYTLMISNMFYIGQCYVDVWDGEVTVSYALADNTAVEPLSSYGRWFTALHQITADTIDSAADGFAFGEPVSIADDLGGADVALLFIRCKATYYQPFRDGSALTRYWRNKPDWKEFREGLQELMPLVEK